ncbi:transposable element-derived 1-like [Octopus vulgaris]|uniref:Transposable element-derived 1-like n=1 Tax=Octopus vulgaris TaxID=6645 RepID=A0AA36BUC1_OCTVU|nr:transposable element-derived 1-like [Octopus vulgaris]
MNNTGGYALELSYEGVQIEFLQPNITSLTHPMNQGVIHAFKALYRRKSLKNLVEARDSDDNFSLKEYWRGYTIVMCFQNIQKALKQMNKVTLNASRKKLWPEAVHKHKGFSPDEIYHSAVDKVVKPAKLLGGDGFTKMTTEDVNNLIQDHPDPLMDEEMTKSASEEEERQEDPRKEEVGLSLEPLSTLAKTAKELQRMVED